MLFLKKKEKTEFNEEEILCDLIENYIELANASKSTLDEYISIIALIKMIIPQYKKYYKRLNLYLNKFEENGIVNEYEKCKTNIAKNIFSENDFKPNIELADKRLYNFFDGCTDWGMHYLIIYGLCGKPITPKQRYIMAKLFQGNYYCFYKQKRYYSMLALKDKHYNPITNNEEKKNWKNINDYQMNKEIAIAYRKEKNEGKYEEYLLKAKQCYDIGSDDLARFYITNKQFDKAKNEIDLIISRRERQAEEDGYMYNLDNDTYTKQLVDYYNQKKNYPYQRKDILEKFNIDIKTFNQIAKDIKDNSEYKNLQGYSEKAMIYFSNIFKTQNRKED